MKFGTIFNEEYDLPCIGCMVADNSKFVQGRIYQTKLWNLSQDFELAYPGMVVLSPMRHVTFYDELTDEEIKQLHELTVKTRKCLKEIFGSDKFAFSFYEREGGHVHFIIVPMHGIIKYENKYSIVKELQDIREELKNDKENMKLVLDTIARMRKWFRK